MPRPRKNRSLMWAPDDERSARDTQGYLVRFKGDAATLQAFNADTRGFVWFDSAAEMTEWENSGVDDGFRYLYIESLTLQEICERWRIPRTVVDRFKVSYWVVDPATNTKRYAPIIVLRKIRAVARKHGYNTPQDFFNALLDARRKAQANRRKCVSNQPTT